MVLSPSKSKGSAASDLSGDRVGGALEADDPRQSRLADSRTEERGQQDVMLILAIIDKGCTEASTFAFECL
jgi:hypothetical protein